METNFVSHDFWATRFYACIWPQHGGEAAGIIDFVYKLRGEQKSRIESGVAPGAKSGHGLYESDFDFLARPHLGVQKLRQFIERQVLKAALDVNRSETTEDDLEVDVSESWFHVTNGGGYHDAHVHGGCSWCGIYYLQIGDSGASEGGGAPNGGSRFYSPLWRGGAHQDFGNRYLGKAYIDPPIQDGMLLLFPSYLLHSGLPYTGRKDRIVIAFNSRTELKTA